MYQSLETFRAFGEPILCNNHVRTASSHGQSFARAHCRVERWPSRAAARVVELSHGQPFCRAHWSTSACPPSAAARQVMWSHGQPFSLAHLRMWRCPDLDARVGGAKDDAQTSSFFDVGKLETCLISKRGERGVGILFGLRCNVPVWHFISGVATHTGGGRQNKG